MIFGRKLKHSILRRNPCHLQWEELLGRAILQALYGKISVQWQILLGPLTTEIRSLNALRTVPCHNDVINEHELRQIVTGLKNNKAVGNDGIPSEVYKFASEQLLAMMTKLFPVYAGW